MADTDRILRSPKPRFDGLLVGVLTTAPKLTFLPVERRHHARVFVDVRGTVFECDAYDQVAKKSESLRKGQTVRVICRVLKHPSQLSNGDGWIGFEAASISAYRQK